jgi:hypothetical protein
MTSKIKVDNIENQCGGAVVTKCGGTTTISGSVVKSNALQAADGGNLVNQCGTTITLGASGDTINLASGATQSGFGRTGTVDWDTTPKTATFSAVSGNGYFCNTSGGAFTVNLPAGSAGAIVSLADYAGTWQTSNITVAPNGTDKIGSTNANATLNVEGQSVTFVFVDSTQGWINTMDSTSNVRGTVPFVAATGGTITTVDTDYKVHTFTGPGTFTVTNAGTPAGSDTVDYLVVAGGGGGGGRDHGGGGGAGGFRESSGAASGSYSASPLGSGVSALPVAVQGYPIVVGAGGAGYGDGFPSNSYGQGTPGSNSSFSPITSTGGGGGSTQCFPSGLTGGSGGGGSTCNSPSSIGAGNTPPVSPPQGNPGTAASYGAPHYGFSAGGGATSPGTVSTPTTGGTGGNGATTSISASPTAYAGGGGGSVYQGGNLGAGGPGGGGNGTIGGPAPNSANGIAGTTNTGGGGGGGERCVPTPGGKAGGSGIVIIRYKFQ